MYIGRNTGNGSKFVSCGNTILDPGQMTSVFLVVEVLVLCLFELNQKCDLHGAPLGIRNLIASKSISINPRQQSARSKTFKPRSRE